MIVDKTQLLMKKCINDEQKLKETIDILFVIFLLIVLFTEVYFKENVFLGHLTSSPHIKNESTF